MNGLEGNDEAARELSGSDTDGLCSQGIWTTVCGNAPSRKPFYHRPF